MEKGGWERERRGKGERGGRGRDNYYERTLDSSLNFTKLNTRSWSCFERKEKEDWVGRGVFGEERGGGKKKNPIALDPTNRRTSSGDAVSIRVGDSLLPWWREGR